VSTLKGIAFRQQKNGAMETLEKSHITTQAGVVGDFRGKPGKRQVTVLSDVCWTKTCSELNEQLPWTARRSNLFISDIQFGPQDVGKTLLIGDCALLITRETDPCNKIDMAHPGLKQALSPNWRGGVCCKVITSGEVHIGDSVKLVKQSK
jgi:MOSC domain-containing protein YiiM